MARSSPGKIWGNLAMARSRHGKIWPSQAS